MLEIIEHNAKNYLKKQKLFLTVFAFLCFPHILFLIYKRNSGTYEYSKKVNKKIASEKK